MPLAILFYDVVKAVHVMAIVLAFGVTFAYPIMLAAVRRAHPHALASFHAVQDRVGALLIGPSAVLALLTGLYMAIDRDLLDETWVSIPLLILLSQLVLAPTFYIPHERRARDLAAQDAAAAGDGPITESVEYQAVAGRIALVGSVSGLLILLAVFLMVAKP